MNLRYGGNILETTRRRRRDWKQMPPSFSVFPHLQTYFLSFVFGFVQGEQNNDRYKVVCFRDPLPPDVWSQRQEYGEGVNSWQHPQWFSHFEEIQSDDSDTDKYWAAGTRLFREPKVKSSSNDGKQSLYKQAVNATNVFKCYLCIRIVNKWSYLNVILLLPLQFILLTQRPIWWSSGGCLCPLLASLVLARPKLHGRGNFERREAGTRERERVTLLQTTDRGWQQLTSALVLTTPQNIEAVMSSSSIRNSPVVAASNPGSRTMSIDRGRARTRNSATTAGSSMTR